ncbi:MAG: exodeoxyribonuclease III [Candidatus Aenigmarchaeota archaeon]|nr:exodeoxyribonuclease III [Candidatus Aenigmarchaeota archaeon]
MKLISWNVNGLRAVVNKGFYAFVDSAKPDILCLQEVKTHPSQVDLQLPGYEHFWNVGEKKGYAGVAFFTKVKPLHVTYGMGIAQHDKEGRLITAEFDHCFVLCVYTPNAQHGLTRLKYRMQWDHDFLAYVKKLEQKKPVILCGDLNVAHTEIDLANPKQNVKNAGFTLQEREGFSRLLQAGFVDTFREFVKEGGHYSWWTYRFNARKRNIGWRIDYVCVSRALRTKLTSAFILNDVLGSDHCPVGISITIH